MFRITKKRNNKIEVLDMVEKTTKEYEVADSQAAERLLVELNLPEVKATVAAHRYELEVKGIEVNGMHIATDRASQAQISNTYASLNAGFIKSTQWKGADGWVEMTLEDFTPIAESVAAHVSACFDAEKIIHDRLNMITTRRDLREFEMDAEFDQAFTDLTA